ncbi:MAG: hypothetical protein DI598_01945 [Pseudopedobacter saltans]|uniref:Uncharacterized protein n=1 Tax=Pseudopedobacter saltans TaxID=151895 RepID=A0A2W5F7G1_9SPHI|nr:MAG: hypothetical protein DI598_01945 [Pseudopedobacter saltans]
MKKLYSKTLFFLIPGLLTLLSVNGQRRLVNLDFDKDARIVAYGTSSAISTTSTAIDGSYVFAGTGYSGGASSGSKITLGGTVIGQRGGGEIFTIPAAGSNNARQINFSSGSSTTVNFNNTGGYKFSNIYYLTCCAFRQYLFLGCLSFV